MRRKQFLHHFEYLRADGQEHVSNCGWDYSAWQWLPEQERC